MSCGARRVPRRGMTADELELARGLGACTFSVGSFDKRFARDLAGAAAGDQLISDKQAALLPVKVVRYRRQIPAAVVELARRLIARGAS